MEPFVYPDPIQGGDEKVTRQVGIDPTQQVMARDPQPLKEIVQGDPEVTATRNVGNGAQRFGLDGTLYADHVADDSTLYADHRVIAIGEPNPPPAASNIPLPPVDAFLADKPGEGGGDPRDLGGAPVTITPEQIAAARAAKKR